jgi:hypothetical protein
MHDVRICGTPGIATRVAEAVGLPYDDLRGVLDADGYVFVVSSDADRVFLGQLLDPEQGVPVRAVVAWGLDPQSVSYLADEALHVFVGMPSEHGEQFVARVMAPGRDAPDPADLVRLTALHQALVSPEGVLP